MRQFDGRRVLLTIGENDAVRCAAVEMISPNGAYVRLGGNLHFDESIGWVPVASVKVLDDLGSADMTASETIRAMKERSWAANK